MNGEWFLWGGFVGSLLWHVSSWASYYRFKTEGGGFDDAVVTYLKSIDFGLSGIALCTFGYLVF